MNAAYKWINLFLLTCFWGGLHAAPQAVILQYHHVDNGTPAITSITPELFDQHLKYIQDHGYVVWPLDDAVEAIRNAQPLPDKTVVITIDDAYRSVYEEVFPRMKKLGWPFTVFVNPDAHDNQQKHYVTWDQMREMKQHGVLFANHTHSHLHMLRQHQDESESQWLDRMRHDIETAQQRLIEELGDAPMLFAYPYGEHSPPLRKLITDMGYTGFGQQSGPVGPQMDFAALPRFPMAAHFAGMRRFPEKLNTLPFPVLSVEPQNAVLEGNNGQPELRVTFGESNYQRNAMACYISGQSAKGDISWQANTLIVKAKQPLAAGRSRYNCTAPNRKGGGYYWYSHSWFKKNKDGSWYKEY